MSETTSPTQIDGVRRDSETAGLTAREAAAAGLLMVAGWTLIYLTMFDQGATLDLLFGGVSQNGMFHELFHDGRHLGAFPCH